MFWGDPVYIYIYVCVLVPNPCLNVLNHVRACLSAHGGNNFEGSQLVVSTNATHPRVGPPAFCASKWLARHRACLDTADSRGKVRGDTRRSQANVELRLESPAFLTQLLGTPKIPVSDYVSYLVDIKICYIYTFIGGHPSFTDCPSVLAGKSNNLCSMLVQLPGVRLETKKCHKYLAWQGSPPGSNPHLALSLNGWHTQRWLVNLIPTLLEVHVMLNWHRSRRLRKRFLFEENGLPQSPQSGSIQLAKQKEAYANVCSVLFE